MIFSGDWHGKFKSVISAIDKCGITDDDILQVGDFGVGFNHNDVMILHDLNCALQDRNLRVYAFRGNHDDKRYFLGKYFNKSPKESVFSNLFLVPDYTLLELQGHNILCIGGAISIDRLRMKTEMAKEEAAGTLPIYFESERFHFDMEKLYSFKNGPNIDILATHTAPSYCLPFDKGPTDPLDISLRKELEEERNQLTSVMDILLERHKIIHHYYGHFHKSFLLEDRGVIHCCLGINEFKEVR